MPVNLQKEKRAVAALAFLYALRMFGLFMVLPVLSLYAADYSGSTPFLMGMALGVYGISQSLLQMPMGLLSDKIGRRPVVIAGLVLFAVGSVVAALSTSIYGLLLGRFLQGCGAVSSALMALVSDLSSEQNRTRAMATVGASIGISFSAAMIAGPMMSAYGGLSTLFWITFILALLGILLMAFVVPVQTGAERIQAHHDTLPAPKLLLRVLKDPDLLRLNAGIFVLHCALMACFTVMPALLEQQLGLPRAKHWEVYLPVLVGSFIAMLPLMIVAERKRQMKRVFLIAVGMLAIAFGWLALDYTSNIGLLTGLFLFFFAFNLLEAQLPSLVSKLSFAGGRGTAMGVYSTCQFLGISTGGILGGLLHQYSHPAALFGLLALLALIWWGLAFGMREPRYLTNIMLKVAATPDNAETMRSQLAEIQGVEEVLVAPEEETAYLKINDVTLDRPALEVFRMV